MSDGWPGPGGGEFAPGAFRARFPRWVWVGLASWLLAGVALLVVPAVLGWLGGRYQNDVTDELSSCRTNGLAGLDDAETADGILRVQSWFPFWAPRAAPKRAELVAQVAAGVGRAAGGSPPAGLVERGVGFVAGGLPDASAPPPTRTPCATASRSSSSPSAERRSWSPWRDGSPRGGDAGRGVGAHRRLGDPGGAARVWRASDAATSPRTATWRGKGVVLCLAGDYDAALPELERHWRTSVEADRSGTWRAEFLGVVAECALRAGDKAQLDVAVDEMSRTRRGRALAFRYEAESDPGKAVARLQRRLALDPNGENDRSTLDDQVFALSLLADAGAPDELPAYAAGGPAGLELAVLEANPPGESLYDDRLHPPFDGRLRRAIIALADPNPAARCGRRADSSCSPCAWAAAGRPDGGGWRVRRRSGRVDAAQRIGATFHLHGEGRATRRSRRGLASGARRRAARRGPPATLSPCSCG